jgi:hypothetical protein
VTSAGAPGCDDDDSTWTCGGSLGLLLNDDEESTGICGGSLGALVDDESVPIGMRGLCTSMPGKASWPCACSPQA